MSVALPSSYLRIASIGNIFKGKYGELQGQAIRMIELTQVELVNGVLTRKDILDFNGIKSFVPTIEDGSIPFKIGDLIEVSFNVISYNFGVDIFGTASINYKHLKVIRLDEIIEQKSNTSATKRQFSKELFEAFDEMNKLYKYYTAKRYIEDKFLSKKFRYEIENIDRIYKGPGSQYTYEELKKQFER